MLSHATLKTLTSTPPGPHVSLFLPTSPSSDTTQDAALHLKNLAKEAQQGLVDFGLSAAEATSMMEGVHALVSDRQYWQHQSAGLALFVSHQGLTEVSVDYTLEPRAVVGEGVDVVPLLPALTVGDTYAVVCASQEEVSVYEGTASGLEPVTIDGMPTSLEDVLTNDDYENPVLASPSARPNLGTHNMSNSQVYGAAPPEWQSMVRRKFAERIASALSSSPNYPQGPLVLISDDALAGDLSGAIHAAAIDTTHPESMSVAERHAASWALAYPLLDAPRQELLETVASRVGRGEKVVTDWSDIGQAARDGAVDVLAIATTEPNPVVAEAMRNTVSQGGQVVWAGDATPALTTGAAALLRF